MLMELHVKNLAVIDDLRLEFGAGLTVLSGDEGAGKSLLVDALCLLTGGKASTALIRSGTASTLVECIFHVLPDSSDVTSVLEEAGLGESDGTAPGLMKDLARAVRAGVYDPVPAGGPRENEDEDDDEMEEKNEAARAVAGQRRGNGRPAITEPRP